LPLNGFVQAWHSKLHLHMFTASDCCISESSQLPAFCKVVVGTPAVDRLQDAYFVPSKAHLDMKVKIGAEL